jgi:hypothetical protein
MVEDQFPAGLGGGARRLTHSEVADDKHGMAEPMRRPHKLAGSVYKVVSAAIVLTTSCGTPP